MVDARGGRDITQRRLCKMLYEYNMFDGVSVDHLFVRLHTKVKVMFSVSSY